MAPAPSRPRNRDAFKLAVLCALSLEAGMVESVFDEFWDDSNAYGKAPGDENAYTLGVVGNHNVVLAHMPGMGSNNAAIAAASLRSSFREIEVIFVVGICGVAPINIQTKEEIVLGDCIISTGVVQYDFGRQYPNGFVEKDGIQDSLGRASNEIRAWLSKLTTPRTRARLTNHLAQHLQLLQKTRPDARYPGWQRDRLYQPSYLHRHQNENVCNACLRDVGVCKKDCELIGCDDDKLIKRNQFQVLQISLDEIQYNSPNLHFGKFGSANTVMKSGSHRDFIAEKNELIAFEMEGAGVWEIFRTVIVKSACDYADSHKSKEWQPYAAATAAAGLKALLETWDVADQPLETVHQMLAQTRNDNNTRARGELHLKDVASLNKEDRECLAKLHLTTPALDKERIEKRAGGLFRDCYTWILDHNAFKKWREGYENLLWIKGDPGKGKTMLLCGIIDELVDTPLVSYFFCQATYDETNNSATAILRGLLWMLVDQNPRLIQYIKNEADRSSESIYSNANSFFNLSKILQNLLQDIGTAIFIVDALDECIDGRNDLIDLIRKTQTRIKWLISSRNWPVIEERLRDTPKVSMEIEDSVGIAVQSYIKLKVSRLATLKMYSQDLKTFILEYLSKHAQGTFLWCALVCTSLENVSKREVRRIINELPPTLDALYRRMLESVTTKSYALTLSRILATATCVYRPVSTLEMGNVIDLSEDDMDSMEELVEECGSFLTIRDGIVEFVHLSAQEYVKKYLPLAIEAKSTHQELYHCSLRAMSRTLKRNVCELGDVCIHISEVVLPVTNPLVPITYCCSFWARHLEESGTIASELLDNSPLSKFFYNNLLFWLEAIGFLKIASNAVLAMHILYSITKDFATCQLQSFILDARRFVLLSRNLLDEYPLQIYDSGLLFSPVNSLVKRAYASTAPTWVTMPLNPLLDWPSSTTTFTLDKHGRGSAVYMSNSDQIALGTSDGRILLYCLITGTLDQSLDLSQSPEVDAHAAVIFGDLAYNRSNSFLVFIFKYVENGREEEETHLRNDTATSKLACWDLKSSQVEILRTFPSDCKLSRDAMFVAYNVYQANKTSLWYYDIRHSHNFALHTRNEFIVDSAFAITGAVIAIWWDSDFIEVWDLEKQSCLGVIEHQRSPIAYTYMVLSQHGDILAIALDNCDPSINEVEVFEVKTGSLLWSKADRKQVGFESWEACTFLEDTPNMAINCMNSIRIYDAYTGTVIDEMDSLLQHHEWSSKPLHCGKQLAFISYDTVELLDLFTEISGPSTSMMLYKPFAIRGEILITNVIDKLHETEWYEDCKFDTGECVWKSPAFPRKLFDQRYRRTNSNHFIERQHRTVVISHLNGTSLQKHSTFDIPEEAEMTCSPGGFYIVLWQQDFTSIYDIESRTMTTDLTSSVMISGLSCGVELDQDQRKDFARPQWSLEGERLVKEVKKGLLMWSKEKGFQKFALDIRGQLRLSSCGTWLACCIPQAIDPVPNLLESPERLHHHKLQIYHVETKEIRSVLDIGMNYRDWDCLYCNLEIAFLPDKQQILILGESWQLWSFSGCSGERLCYIPIANHYTAFTQFTSPTDLETNRGIISLSDNEIRLGSVDRPFEHGSEIYINNYKVLQLPLYYNFWHLVYSTGRLALTGGGRGRITTLDFSISHASESEREAFHETHKAVTTS